MSIQKIFHIVVINYGKVINVAVKCSNVPDIKPEQFNVSCFVLFSF